MIILFHRLELSISSTLKMIMYKFRITRISFKFFCSHFSDSEKDPEASLVEVASEEGRESSEGHETESVDEDEQQLEVEGGVRETTEVGGEIEERGKIIEEDKDEEDRVREETTSQEENQRGEKRKVDLLGGDEETV